MSLDRKFSDGLPIQMWPGGTKSFNKKTSYKVQSIPWTYQHKCSVAIPIRFIEKARTARRLQILKEGVEVYNELFDQEDVIEVIPIVDDLQFNNSQFNMGGLEPWENEPVPGVEPGQPWVWDTSKAKCLFVSESGFVDSTQYLTQRRPNSDFGWPPGDYVIGVRIKNNTKTVDDATPTSCNFWLYGTDDSVSYEFLAATDTLSLSDNAFHDLQIHVTTTKYWDAFAFFCSTDTGEPTNFDVEVDLLEIQGGPDIDTIYYYTIYSAEILPSALELCDSCGVINFLIADVVEWFSDSIHFVTETEWLQVSYRSSKFNAGIPYDSESPFFNIFVNAQFFEDRFITEAKTIQLSNTEISTASSLKTQRRLEIVEEGTPDYFIKKLILALQHSTPGAVVIDGLSWNFALGLEKKDDRPETYPLHRALGWLTEKDDYQTNQI